MGWSSLRDVSSDEYSKKFIEYKKNGYILTDVDAYLKDDSLKFSMVWRQNTDRRDSVSFHDMTTQIYNDKWTEFGKKGYRPTDIESYQMNGKQLYAGIWVENKEKYQWTSKRDMTRSEYDIYYRQKLKDGFRLVDFEAYPTREGLKFACIWINDGKKLSWMHMKGENRETYQAEVNKLSRQGFILTDFETYRSGNQVLFAAIWEQRSGFATAVRSELTATQFANYWREYRDMGFRLVDFEQYSTDKYAGVWIENNSRYRFKDKAKIDKLLEDYQKANNIPGISAAVTQNGKMVYRRGFGFADVKAGKVAHAETVYNAASISKAIGGTLAVKVVEKGQLDLEDDTDTILKNVRNSKRTSVSISEEHNYPVKYLFSHLACIKHYEGKQPTAQYYAKAIDALEKIWDEDFVSGCEKGVNRNYSTHAFTYAAAVLEKNTNKSIADLLRDEITKPHELSSMRVMFENRRLVPDYDRTVFYDESNRLINSEENSWKILGGGIETSPVDLARFGWKVLNGQIVSPKSRDDILWTRVNSNALNGIGWEVSGSGNILEHGGSADGTRTQLRIYRDKGLVIAIMSNRRGHNGLPNLSGSIAAIF